jgi:crotonobetainyl-CoA:carnitine CoA-transferase CaiB-like acyl-CoA transferase
MAGPLQGYRVIDLTTMISGPLATMVLGDQGADIIKVEMPGQGDHVRTGGNRAGGLAATFLNNNRNKRSIALNLKDLRGREVLKRLAAGADVFIQNFRPGVVERLGVGEAEIRAVAPDIVYVSINGFGEHGPYVAKPVYDPIIQAASGLASVQGGSDHNRPRLVRTILPDKLTGVTAAQAVTAALLARERTGLGQHVRLSMLDAVIAFLWSSDMGSQTFVDRAVSEQQAARTTAAWQERLEAEGVPCMPVLTRNQLLDHPQVAAGGVIVETDHPQAGRLRQARPAARFEQTPAEIRRGAPLLGEHSDEILAELGLPDAEITALRRDGVVDGPGEAPVAGRALGD